VHGRQPPIAATIGLTGYVDSGGAMGRQTPKGAVVCQRHSKSLRDFTGVIDSRGYGGVWRRVRWLWTASPTRRSGMPATHTGSRCRSGRRRTVMPRPAKPCGMQAEAAVCRQRSDRDRAGCRRFDSVDEGGCARNIRLSRLIGICSGTAAAVAGGEEARGCPSYGSERMSGSRDGRFGSNTGSQVVSCCGRVSSGYRANGVRNEPEGPARRLRR
jgi:hypothetical protein